MFPQDSINYEEVITEETKPLGKAILFDYGDNNFVVKDGKIIEARNLEKIKQWVELMLRTPKSKFQIYAETDFGINLENYVGYKQSQLGFVKSELKREIEETITINRMISGIKDFDATPENDVLHVSFTVITKTEEELEVSVYV